MTGIDDKLIEGLLKEASAPAVISGEGLAMLSMCVAEIANYAKAAVEEQAKGKYQDEGKKLRQKANAAVNELRRVVPKITAALRMFPIRVDQEKADELDAWLKTLPDFPPKKPEWQQTWAIHAVWLFSAYKRATGPCGVTRDSPAIRFIKLVLDRYGYRKNHEAIFDALREARESPEGVRYFEELLNSSRRK